MSYGLSRGDYYYTIAKKISHGLSSIQNIINEMCSIIMSSLCRKFAIFESDKQILRAIFKMESMCHFPGAFDGIEGFRIPIKCPHGRNEAHKEYYNFKNFYSIFIMGIVAAYYKFSLFLNIGYIVLYDGRFRNLMD